jgi:hypothetical protein
MNMVYRGSRSFPDRILDAFITVKYRDVLTSQSCSISTQIIQFPHLSTGASSILLNSLKRTSVSH